MSWLSVEYWRLGAALLPLALCIRGLFAEILWQAVWLSEFREVIALFSHTTQSTWITLVLLWEKEGSASSSSYHVMPCPCVPRASCYSPLTYSDSSCFSALSPCLFYGPMGPCVLLQEPLHSAPDAWMPFRASPVYLSSHHASLDGPCSDHPPQPCHSLSPNFTCL